MQHIINVAFDFDDKRITESIEEQVHKQVVDNITNEVKKIIFKTNYYNVINENDSEPLKKMVELHIKEILNDNKDEIIEMAANKLVNSLKRSKDVKEAVGQVLEENT